MECCYYYKDYDCVTVLTLTYLYRDIIIGRCLVGSLTLRFLIIENELSNFFLDNGETDEFELVPLYSLSRLDAVLK